MELLWLEVMEKAMELNQLSYPWGVYVDDDQTIYVADY